MRHILVVIPTAWLAGVVAYYMALFVFFGETPTDVTAVFFSSFLALLVCIPVLYSPVLFGLRRLLGGWKPLIAFPITATLLGIGPTAFVFLWWGGGDLSSLFSPEAAEDEKNDAQLLKLTLRPAQDAYDLAEEARLGNVTLIASLENSGNTPLILAHPNVCFPHDYQEGESFHMTEREGKSEISVLISLPNETQISLRNNLLRMFEPGHKDHLIIQPGESKEIRFGWFGPASLGQWDYDSGGAITEPIFSQKGTYHLGVKFTNLFPKAYIYDGVGNSHLIDTAWTGEVQSNTIIVIQ